MNAMSALLDRAVRGDDGAWTQLVAEHRRAVWALCCRLDPEPEDAWQEIWEKVARGVSRFRPDGPASFRTWLMRVAHRQLIDRHRKRRARGEAEPLHEVPGRCDVERASAARRQVARLEAALAGLPDAQRRVLVLHHVHGVPLARIAQDEGVAVGTVKSRLHRGRAALALRMEEPG